MIVYLSVYKIKRCVKYLVLCCINGFMWLFGIILYLLKFFLKVFFKYIKMICYLLY